MRTIFDLDGTVLDSTHRQLTKPDGTLDLKHWIENSKPEKVLQDSLLPLASLMRASYRRNNYVIVCTARVMDAADFELLRMHNLNFHTILYRPEGCTMGDADLKEIQLRLFAQRKGLTWRKFTAGAVIFDDSASVLARMSQIGIMAVNAVQHNAMVLQGRKAA